MTPTIGIAGGTGFTGKYISKLLLEQGFKVIIFTRNPRIKSIIPNLSYALYDPQKGLCEIEAVKQLTGAIHLAGAGVADKRWTKKRKEEIISSRLESTQFFLRQLYDYGLYCKTYVAASAIGYYGPDKTGHSFVETDAPYTDFLADTVIRWEDASHEAEKQMRTVIFRIGIVLGKESGAFPEFFNPLKMGVRPYLGNGQQMISWIHVEDIAGMFVYALQHEEMSGIYNAVAPNPVSNKQLMNTIATTKGGFSIPMYVPSVFLKIGLGEMSIEVLKSTTASAEKIMNAGYKFKYEAIEKAVGSLID